MMTGLYPTRHGIHNNGDAILADEFDTLAESLSAEGYATVAAVSAFVTTRVWNLDQGFADYFDSVKGDKDRKERGRWAQERPADQVVDDLVGWLDEHKTDDRPFFLWAHFYDPHDPYRPPGDWRKKAGGRAYDGEIGFMDSQIARLQAAVDAQTGDAGTAWVLVADHGEALTREHGEHTHGMYLYDPTMRIPFIVKPPKDLAEPIVESKHTVSNVDVTPTVLGMLGFDAPKDIDGLDLTPVLSGGSIERTPVYMEAESARNRFGFAPERAMAHGPLKLMDTPNPRLFNVVVDPGETTNLVEEKPKDVTRLQTAHEAIQARRVDASGGGMASPEVLAQLEALGYMTSDGSVGDDETAKLDAKDQRELISRLDKARALNRQGKLKQAIEEYKAVLAEHPQIGEARMNMARAYGAMKQSDKAEEVLREAVQLDPKSTVLKSNLASHLVTQGEFEEAYALYQNILTQVPGDDIARNGIARMYLATGKFDKALAACDAWKVEDPDTLAWDGYRGIALANLNRLPEAVTALQASLADDMPRKDVHQTLGNIAMIVNDVDAALMHFEQETNWFPDDIKTRMRVGGIYMRQERWEDASVEFSYVAVRAKGDPVSRRMWAQAVFNAGDYPGANKVLGPAVSVHPDDPFIMLLHANILQKLGKEQEALEVFERSKALRRAQIDAQKERADAPSLPGLNDANLVEAEMDQYGIPE
jgi:arylsulfatase A-like enzyme/Tfp pilus assembly protein PilF